MWKPTFLRQIQRPPASMSVNIEPVDEGLVSAIYDNIQKGCLFETPLAPKAVGGRAGNLYFKHKLADSNHISTLIIDMY